MCVSFLVMQIAIYIAIEIEAFQRDDTHLLEQA